MTEIPNPKQAADLLVQLRKLQEVSHRRVEGGGLPPEVVMFRAWQAQRLATTHADLLASKRYGPACRFFLDDIYGPKDFAQRDHDIVRIHNFMLRFLPASVLAPLTRAIELNSLTAELDDRLLRVLVDEVGVTDSITPEQYAEGYRICDNYDERKRQIEMIGEVGRGIARLVRIPFLGMTLRLTRGPARRGGWQEMQGFLERGFSAFKRMGGKADTFLDTLQQREMQILDQIYAGSDDPFTVD
ncbi:MAG TPA: hypothetical protein G4N94_01300 [Caldilineae bacterium]|nr:hypothetical protein [Caldilineae bacterium]